jgi:hypothetical protein
LSYDPTNSQFAAIAGASGLPGPVNALTIATDSGDEIWAAGQGRDGAAYLQRFDGQKWTSVANAMFGPGTDIRGIQVLSLSQNHGKSNLIDQGQDLLLMGQINIAKFGVVSGALFNGTNLIPFMLATKGSDGSTTDGSLSSVFVENPNFFFRQSSKFHE